MARYIDAENIPTKFVNFGMPTVISGIEVPDIDNAPTISPDEVRGAGKWITTRTWEHDGDPYCSLCGFENCYTTNSRDFKYCPNCGTRLRMKGAEDGTTG